MKEIINIIIGLLILNTVFNIVLIKLNLRRKKDGFKQSKRIKVYFIDGSEKIKKISSKLTESDIIKLLNNQFGNTWKNYKRL